MSKTITRNDLMLASLKMLASVYSITGERDIGETLSWASDRIEELESELTQRDSCVHCNTANRRKLVGRRAANVLPFKRD